MTSSGRGGGTHSGVVVPLRGADADGSLVLDAAPLREPRLAAGLAVVLGGDVPADAAPGEVARAVPGQFLALVAFEAHESVTGPDARVLLGEQLIPVDLPGELRLCLGGDFVSYSPASRGDAVSEVGAAAARAGGLRAGDTILLDTCGPSVVATPGTAVLEGPGLSSLSAGLRTAP